MPRSLRVRLIFLFFIGLFVLILIRLAYWQFFQGEVLVEAARNQYLSSRVVFAQRGRILAADQFPMVDNEETFDLAISLAELESTEAGLAATLAPILVEKKADLLVQDQKKVQLDLELDLVEKLDREGASWVQLAKGISRDKYEQIVGLDLAGLYFDQSQRRTYPEGTSSAHLMGFVGQDDEGLPKGYFGLEGWYDRELEGRAGLVVQERDAAGRPIIFGEAEEKEKKIDGRSLVTSLNRTVQLIINEKLAAGIEQYGAASGTVTVMDPTNGQILGMVSLPSYDPIDYASYTDGEHQNPIISSTYEPGSTFKVLVMAAALEHGAVDLETICDQCSGPRTISGFQIDTSEGKYFPDSNLTDIIVHSDNVGMVFVGEQMEFSDLYDQLVRFGFGQQTGIDLQGEEAATIRSISEWYPIDQATLTFGQGIAVTRLQLLRAVAAIANGGKLVTPRVVQGVISDGAVEWFEPAVQKRVLSLETASIVNQMMVAAVEQGHVKRHRLEGFRVAGKTGTAQIAVKGHYDEDKTIASFIGFAPADQPKFIMLVTLREPTASTWGSETAAPVWFEIARELFLYYGILPG